MKISMPMLLFWVAIVLVPIIVSIAAIGIVPNDQSVPMRWDEPGLVHGGSPTKIMIIAMVLATANTFLAASYLFNNNLDLPDLIHGADKRNYRIICIAGALVCASFAIIVAVSWSQALIATTY